jgi:serine protease Do
MNPRARTAASFLSVAMASMIVGAVVSTQVQRPQAALARQGDTETGAPVAKTSKGEQAVITLDTFKDVARMTTKGVVNISTSKIVKHGSDPFRDFFGDDFMEKFFGPKGQGGGGGGSASERQTSLGSGFVIDKDGYILTNRHVIAGADEISVQWGATGKKYPAKLVGKDARTDVALIKIEPKEPLTVVELGDSDKIEVGEWVIAIGNPFGLGGNSVTTGVVSYKGRPLPLAEQGNPIDMIQTDASINPGNSGGPLLNLHGQVIGINTLIITRGLPQSAGVGFAIPINVAKDILQQLRSNGKVVRGWLGVQIMPVDEDLAKSFKMKDAKGTVVTDVTSGSPAEKAGVQPGDVVIAADDHEIEDNSALSRYIAAKSPGTTVKLRLRRSGEEKTIPVVLGTFPEGSEDNEPAEEKSKKHLGMQLRSLTSEMAEHLELPRTLKGVVVVEVEVGEAAEKAGLQRGDVIVSVDDKAVTNVDEFESEITRAQKDGIARLRVRRGSGFIFIVLKF